MVLQPPGPRLWTLDHYRSRHCLDAAVGGLDVLPFSRIARTTKGVTGGAGLRGCVAHQVHRHHFDTHLCPARDRCLVATTAFIIGKVTTRCARLFLPLCRRSLGNRIAVLYPALVATTNSRRRGRASSSSSVVVREPPVAVDPECLFHGNYNYADP